MGGEGPQEEVNNFFIIKTLSQSKLPFKNRELNSDKGDVDHEDNQKAAKQGVIDQHTGNFSHLSRTGPQEE